jgi:hypothetical protein
MHVLYFQKNIQSYKTPTAVYSNPLYQNLNLRTNLYETLHASHGSKPI